MKVEIRTLLAVSFIMFAGCNERAVPVRKVSVVGVATKEMNADRINIKLDIEALAASSSEAVAANAKSVSEVISILNGLKPSISAIEKSGSQFGKRREFDKPIVAAEKHLAQTEVSFILSDLDRFDSLSQLLSKIPCVSIAQSEYTLSTALESRASVRELAIQKAKEKATSMANSLGMKLGKPIEITEGIPNYRRFSGGNAIQTSDPTQNSNGKFIIEAEVEVVFEME